MATKRELKQWVVTFVGLVLLGYVLKSVFYEPAPEAPAPRPPTLEEFKQRFGETKKEYCRKYAIKSAECQELLK